MMFRRRIVRIMDVLLLGALALYILLGVANVPFHGDESTTMYIAADWFRVVRGDFQTMFLRLPPPDDQYALEQYLRIQNGVVSKYMIGFALMLSGRDARVLPDQWYWGADWDYNVQNGHYPSREVLMVGRLSSAVPTALALPFIFLAGLRLGGRRCAYPAVILFALMPLVLVNGRRVMYEGALLLVTVSLVSASLLAADNLKRSRRRWLSVLLVGLAAGFAVATKHTLLIVIAPAFLSLLIYGGGRFSLRLARVTLAGLVMAGVFFVLNPAWWNAPLTALRLVPQIRLDILKSQQQIFGAFDSLPARIAAPFEAIFGPGQYYEDKGGWPEWIAGEIAAYEASPLKGFAVGGLVGAGLVILGTVTLLITHRNARFPEAHTMILLIAGIALMALYATNALPWWRYYLPLSIPFTLIAGAGIGLAGETAWRLITQRTTRQIAG